MERSSSKASGRNAGGEQRFKKLKRTMILGYSLIILAAVTAVSFVCIFLTQQIYRKHVGELVAELSMQMSMNLDSYVENMENFNTLVFADKINYTYDATENDLEEYDVLETEKNIKNALYRLCIMDNYVDYFIVYSNEHTVGKYSNGTRDLFDGKVYELAKDYVKRPRTQDGWFTGVYDDYKRIYYVKRVNENALLITSIYTSELNNQLEHPGSFADMVIRVTNEDDIVLYSQDKEEIGSPLSEDLRTIIGDNDNASIDNASQLIAVTTGVNDWHVICSLPTSALRKQFNSIAMTTISIAAVAVLISILLSSMFIIRMTNPVQNMVGDLDKKASTDALTGIYNKKVFEEMVARYIVNFTEGDLIFLLFDVDNFKGVNDTLGHAWGDQVLADVGKIMRSKFRENDLLGRLGGDEFAVFMKVGVLTETTLEDFVSERCNALCEGFRNYYAGDKKELKISISMGASIYGRHGEDFETLYKIADRALYEAKQSGKDTYRLYRDKQEENA